MRRNTDIMGHKDPTFDAFLVGSNFSESRTRDVASKHQGAAATNQTGQSIISAPLVRAGYRYMYLTSGDDHVQNRDGRWGEFGIGTHADEISLAEIRMKDKAYIAQYNSSTGRIGVAIYDCTSEGVFKQANGDDTREDQPILDAVLLAMMPVLANESIDAEMVSSLHTAFLTNAALFSDVSNTLADDQRKVWADSLGVMSDNVFRRIDKDLVPVNIAPNRGGSSSRNRSDLPILTCGLLNLQTNLMMDTAMGTFSVLRSKAAIYTNADLQKKESDNAAINKEFAGKYVVDESRKLTSEEEQLMCSLPDWYIIPKFVHDDCIIIKKTRESNSPIRNFLFYGPAGTGKSSAADAISAGIGVPIVKCTFSAGTTEEDIFGRYTPAPDGIDMRLTNTETKMKLDKLKEMGGITKNNIAKMIELPEVLDLCYDPVNAYKAMTGKARTPDGMDPGIAAAVDVWTTKVMKEYGQLLSSIYSKNSSTPPLVYIESELVRAVRNGWVCELQEPATIAHPGVLSCLNRLLDRDQKVKLATGELLPRHPDCIVIVTTNMTYEGCRSLNEAFTDRCLPDRVEYPSEEEVISRIVSITGCNDMHMLGNMYDVLADMRKYAAENDVRAEFGMRGFIDWVTVTQALNDPFLAGMKALVNKAGSDEDAYARLKASLETKFPETTPY